MPRLRFHGFAHLARYSSACVGESDWSAGDVRDVSAARATELLGLFPGVFELEPASVQSPAPVRSPRTAAAAPAVTKKKKAPAKKKKKAPAAEKG